MLLPSNHTSARHAMRISVVTSTEDRHAFMPWLWYNFRRQSYTDCELIVVDSSRRGIAHPGDSNIQVIRALPGTTIGAKLNVAIAAASGAYVTRFDDDDWQHPEQLTWKAEAIALTKRELIGWNVGHFVDLTREIVYRYVGRMGGLAPITCAFSRALALTVPFPHASRFEDSRWIATMLTKTIPLELAHDVIHSLWLRHDRNTTRGFHIRRQTPEPLDAVIKRIGPTAWGDTSTQLVMLKQRLAARGSRSVD